jgi:hypothetical protein
MIADVSSPNLTAYCLDIQRNQRDMAVKMSGNMHRSETVEARHLVKRGKVYFVVLDVPAPLRSTLGRVVLTRTTGTGDILQARERRDAILAEFRTRIAKAKLSTAYPFNAWHMDALLAESQRVEDKARELQKQVDEWRYLANWGREKAATLSPVPLVPTVTVLPAVAEVSFREVAEACIASRKGTWKEDQWTPLLTMHAFPTIGAVPVADISTDHVLSVLQPMWATIPNAGKRLRAVIKSVLDYARIRGWRTTPENPAEWPGNLAHVLPLRSV